MESLDELRTFGWSLSSGVDVDNNQYNGKAGKVKGRERERRGERGIKEVRREGEEWMVVEKDMQVGGGKENGDRDGKREKGG